MKLQCAKLVIIANTLNIAYILGIGSELQHIAMVKSIKRNKYTKNRDTT